jgi:hypothetical protein
MGWLANNWIWVVLGIAFVAFHLFGHGGHRTHSVQAPKRSSLDSAPEDRPATKNSDGSSPDAPAAHKHHGA